MNADKPFDPPKRLGVVSFLNARPLVEGLDAAPGIELTYDVPSRLPELLDTLRVDVALAPVINLARHPGEWEIVSDGCIGCDGETLTVRVFSRVRPAEITHLCVDGDSHTSVALAAVVWNEMYGTQLQIRPLQLDQPPSPSADEAVLLIGDKVVTRRPQGFDHEIDLGEAWRNLTGLPFVFAAWTRRVGNDVGPLPQLLQKARDRGVARAADIAREQGPAKGWPTEIAVRYLTEFLTFKLTPRHRTGLELFLELAAKWGIVPRPTQSVFA
ncbi:MAG TPA: menaquinone biosynthesis protein [Phycisphaerae bacterium]|nr:menaquinone biosynthesis protein [Phycisphaerae bacterium]